MLLSTGLIYYFDLATPAAIVVAVKSYTLLSTAESHDALSWGQATNATSKLLKSVELHLYAAYYEPPLNGTGQSANVAVLQQ